MSESGTRRASQQPNPDNDVDIAVISSRDERYLIHTLRHFILQMGKVSDIELNGDHTGVAESLDEVLKFVNTSSCDDNPFAGREREKAFGEGFADAWDAADVEGCCQRTDKYSLDQYQPVYIPDVAPMTRQVCHSSRKLTICEGVMSGVRCRLWSNVSSVGLIGQAQLR